MVDQIRFFAGAARMLEGRSAGEYMTGLHVVRPARAHRCVRAGHAVELPDDDGGVEVRPRHRGREHRRAEARADHAGVDAAPGRDRGRSSCPRVCSTWCAAIATRAGRWCRTPCPRWCRSPAACGPGVEVAIAAADDIKRVHLELGGKAPVVVFDDADVEKAAEGIAVAGYFNAGQDCTAATRVLAGPGVHDDFVDRPRRTGPGPDRGGPRRRRSRLRPAQQRRPAGPGAGLHRQRCPSHAAVRTGGQQHRRARATSTSRPW